MIMMIYDDKDTLFMIVWWTKFNGFWLKKMHAEKMMKRDEKWMFHLQGLCFCISGSLPNRQSNSFSRKNVSCGCARSMPSNSNDDPGASWHSKPSYMCIYLSFHQRCLCLGHYFLTCIQRCSKKRVVISYLYIVSTSGAFAPQFSMQISANLKASRGKPKFLAPLNSVI